MEKVCCRCKKNEREGRWVKEEDSEDKVCSYVFCPNCYQETLAEIIMASEHRFQRTAEMRI